MSNILEESLSLARWTGVGNARHNVLKFALKVALKFSQAFGSQLERFAIFNRIDKLLHLAADSGYYLVIAGEASGDEVGDCECIRVLGSMNVCQEATDLGGWIPSFAIYLSALLEEHLQLAQGRREKLGAAEAKPLVYADPVLSEIAGVSIAT